MIEAPERVIDLRFAPSPYKGLIPYAEEDYAFFFGRDREQQIISANLLASRLTLLYGPSGVGKSSVLRAGVVHRLRERSKRNLANQDRGSPQFIVVEFSSWRDDPMIGLAASIERSVRMVMGDRTPPPPAPHTTTLRDLVTSWTGQLRATLLIILDQFEEYFLYHGREEGEGTFDAEFPRAFELPTIPANFLISIREDAYTLLDRFEGRIPHLFDNNLRVDHLSRTDARAAVERPIERYNELAVPPGTPPYSIEPALVEAVLEEVKAGQVDAAHPGGGLEAEAEDRVEAPYLQLVMSRLWDEEAKEGSRLLRLSTLQRLGGAKEIVRTHLDGALGTLDATELATTAKALRFLVTPSGSKMALSVDALADFTQVPEAELSPLLEKLTGSGLRILRPVDPPAGEPQMRRYEIFHDVLGAAILDWRARFEATRRAELQVEEANAQVEEARRRIRRVGVLAGVSLAVLVLVALAAIWALGQRNSAKHAQAESRQLAQQARQRANEATRLKNQAQSREFAAKALAQAGFDLPGAVSTALEALQTSPTGEAQRALRLLLPELRETGEFSPCASNCPVVWSVETGPTGSGADRIVIASGDGTARILGPDGKQVGPTLEHGGTVTVAHLSRSGNRVLTAGSDGTAKVWDATNGALLLTLSDGMGAITDAKFFDPDPQTEPLLAITASVDAPSPEDATQSTGRVRVWDLETGQALTVTRTINGLLHVSFDLDGTRFITSGDNQYVRVWSTFTGQQAARLDVEDGPAQAGFSPNGKDIVTSDGFGCLGLWHAKDGKFVDWACPFSRPIDTFSFNATGTAAVATSGKRAAIFCLRTCSDDFFDIDSNVVLVGHSDRVESARFSPDGSQLVTASADGTARVWEVASGLPLMVLRGHTDVVWSAEFTSDGRSVVTASQDGSVRLWNVSLGTPLRSQTDFIQEAVFSPNGSIVATASRDETVQLWDRASGTKIGGAIDVVDPVNSVAFNQDGTRLITGDDDGAVGVWDVSNPATPEHLNWFFSDASGVTVTQVAYSSDGTRIFALYSNGTISVLDALDGTRVGPDTDPDGRPIRFALSPDSSLLATADRDRVVRIWDTQTGEKLGELSGHTGLVLTVAFDADGKRILTGSQDHTARVWDGTEGWDAATGRATIFHGSPAPVTAVAFSPDGGWVVAGSGDGFTFIWDAGTAELLATLHEHADFINSIQVGSGNQVLSASDDYTTRMYSCTTCGSLDELLQQARDYLDRLGIEPPAHP